MLLQKNGSAARSFSPILQRSMGEKEREDRVHFSCELVFELFKPVAHPTGVPVNSAIAFKNASLYCFALWSPTPFTKRNS